MMSNMASVYQLSTGASENEQIGCKAFHAAVWERQSGKWKPVKTSWTIPLSSFLLLWKCLPGMETATPSCLNDSAAAMPGKLSHTG